MTLEFWLGLNESEVNFGVLTICMILIIPVHEHERFFYHLLPSSTSFFSFSTFSLQRSFISLVGCIYKYLTSLSILNGIVSLVSSAVSLALVYRKITDTVLIFCPATLLKVFINSKLFWWNIWDLLRIESCNMQIEILQIIFLFVSILFPSLTAFCLIALAKSPSTMLNMNRESGHLSLPFAWS